MTDTTTTTESPDDAEDRERAGDEYAPSAYPRTKLARDTRCITVHGTTGQDLGERILPTGTLVADLRVETTLLAGYPVTATHFSTSTDAGKTWQRQRTYGPVEVESWECGPGCSCGHPDHDTAETAPSPETLGRDAAREAIAQGLLEHEDGLDGALTAMDRSDLPTAEDYQWCADQLGRPAPARMHAPDLTDGERREFWTAYRAELLDVSDAS